MPHRFMIGALLLVALGGCSKADQKQDAFAADTEAFAALEIQCVGERNADGKCAVKSKCTKDADSDCKIYIDACVNGGNHYEGTLDGGTCTRVL